jgi:hypothetical protein
MLKFKLREQAVCTRKQAKLPTSRASDRDLDVAVFRGRQVPLLPLAFPRLPDVIWSAAGPEITVTP